jgi:hypothetical protein
MLVTVRLSMGVPLPRSGSLNGTIAVPLVIGIIVPAPTATTPGRTRTRAINDSRNRSDRWSVASRGMSKRAVST